jgi:hypothetical protein
MLSSMGRIWPLISIILSRSLSASSFSFSSMSRMAWDCCHRTSASLVDIFPVVTRLRTKYVTVAAKKPPAARASDASVQTSVRFAFVPAASARAASMPFTRSARSAAGHRDSLARKARGDAPSVPALDRAEVFLVRYVAMAPLKCRRDGHGPLRSSARIAAITSPQGTVARLGRSSFAVLIDPTSWAPNLYRAMT